MANADRGFASMDPEKQRRIASKGGRAAHRKGVAHVWTKEEASKAGHKGGTERGKRRKAQKAAEALKTAEKEVPIP
ncbi:stress-induced protein [Patescibacteria group bacterium]|nr:stress-induced protein [Patescibacteria group bacterium]